MGYASDMQDLVIHFANIIKSTNSSDSVGQLKDYIAYSEECRGLRSYLYEIDSDYVIEPHTKLTVHNEEDINGDICAAYIQDADDNILYRMTEGEISEYDIQDEDGILAWYYDNHINP